MLVQLHLLVIILNFQELVHLQSHPLEVEVVELTHLMQMELMVDLEEVGVIKVHQMEVLVIHLVHHQAKVVMEEMEFQEHKLAQAVEVIVKLVFKVQVILVVMEVMVHNPQ